MKNIGESELVLSNRLGMKNFLLHWTAKQSLEEVNKSPKLPGCTVRVSCRHRTQQRPRAEGVLEKQKNMRIKGCV